MKDKKLLLVILILVLFVSIGEETYALFTDSVSSVVQSYGTGTLKLSYSSSVISLNNAYPMSNSDGMNMGSGIITITNTGTLAYKFDVKIDVSSSSTLSNDLIKVSVDEQNPEFLSADGNIIIRDIVLNPGSSRSFALKLWIDSSATSSEVLGKKFIGNLTSTGIAVKNMEDSVGTVLVGDDESTLYYYVKSNADRKVQVDFSKSAQETSTNGIYMTTDTDSGKPVYYYRGNVDNHLIFANFCWRIVRTTETKGIKLIYDGVPSNGVCNNTGANIVIDIDTLNLNNSSSINIDTYMSGGGPEEPDSPAYVGYMYGAVYTPEMQDMTLLSGSIVFGNDITYNASTNSYTLKDTYTLTDASNWSSEYTSIGSKYHYTCLTSSNVCEKVNYIYYATEDLYSYYVELSGGKNHLDILKEMLDNSSNTTNSNTKTAIDTWYQNNMTGYTSQLEDTVFCNDRSYDVTESGWDKDYNNSYYQYMYFGARIRMEENSPTLVCKNNNDKFTVSLINGNGALTYPVGLITVDEILFSGFPRSGNISFVSSNYLYDSAVIISSLSPSHFYISGSIFALYRVTWVNYRDSSSTRYLRPVISLKPETIISGGTGTATDPFIVN